MRPPNQLIPILACERDSLAVCQFYPNLFPLLETSRERVGAAIRYDSTNLSQQQQQRQRITTKPEKQRVHDPLISRAPTTCPPSDPAEPRSPPQTRAAPGAWPSAAPFDGPHRVPLPPAVPPEPRLQRSDLALHNPAQPPANANNSTGLILTVVAVCIFHKHNENIMKT